MTFSYTYNTAPRLTGMTSNFVDSTHPATFLSNVHYGRFGVTGDTLGNGLNEIFGYNSVGAFQSYTTTPTTPYAFSLAFAPDGNVASATDNVNGNWTYSYDQFNRLTGSTQNATPQTYVYDRYGNRLQQGSSTYVFDNNNHISGSGVVYDALGNVTNDGFHTYTYDAESRLTKVDGNASLTYQYDAEGRRVHAPMYESVYDLNGRATTLLTLSGMWAYSEIYAGGRHLATYSGGTTNFVHTDWLGTRRVMTSLSGAPTDTCTGLPFGDDTNCLGTEWNFNRFTDYVHDSESNLEHTPFRQYSSTEGRFLSPDPYGGSIDLGNPQSMNRYAYVMDNPTNLTDSLGLEAAGPPFPNGCTLLSGTDGEIFSCPGFTSGPLGGFGDILSVLNGVLNGGGLAGNTVPGTCFLPGACPSLPIPSILDFLPHIPGPGCDPGPCSDDPSNGFGNGLVSTGLGPLSSIFLGNFLSGLLNTNGVGICTPLPPFQFVRNGCFAVCEFVPTYQSNPAPTPGTMDISPENIYQACGHLSVCPTIILVETRGDAGQQEGKVFSCSKIVPPLTFPMIPILPKPQK